jgi:hypothetical protein
MLQRSYLTAISTPTGINGHVTYWFYAVDPIHNTPRTLRHLLNTTANMYGSHGRESESSLPIFLTLTYLLMELSPS